MGGCRKGKGKGKGKGLRRPGRRSGGKGKRRAGGKGQRRSGGFAQFLPSYSQTPAALPDDPIAPFLHPAPRQLTKVPLEFASLKQWCDVIGNNILAEFWSVFKEANSCFSGFGVAAGDELIIENAPADGLSQHLLLLDRQPRIASSQRILAVGKVAVKLRGGAPRTGSVRSLGYVGSFLSEYAATIELRRLPPREMTGPMRAILEPKVDLPGSYARRPLNTAAVPVNPSQRSAVQGLAYALEKIQGPPGTGKSTTIFHILDARLPPGERVLVTCSRNVAVESIAQKLEGLENWPLCVFGPRDRVGETARRYLLDSQVGGHFDERRVQKVAPTIAAHAKDLSAAIESREASCKGRRGERFLLAFLRKRHRAAYALRELCDRLGLYCSVVSVSPDWCQKQIAASKEQVLARSRVFLCTIASTSRLLREWEETTDEELHVHTVIVDECGCTPESSTALLLRLRPSNLVLVGDHKQLPPCSMVPPQNLEGTGHTRSLLERCVLASGMVHQLREQYRMHPSIATLVSGLFYAGRLQTPGVVAEARSRREKCPLVWLDVQGQEQAPTRSYMNGAEVTASVRACARLREQAAPGSSIALLTFYRGQLDALMNAVPSNLAVEVLTVDACQGSEFDYVVLSTVRANRDQRLGFVKDPQRINVAISRARLKLLIVGHRHTLSADGDWRQVQAACANGMAQEFAPRCSLPAQGTFVSVFDMLRQEKDREAAQRAAAALEESASGAGKGGKGGRGSSRSSMTAEVLMQSQTSFRSKAGFHNRGPVRRPDGSYESTSVAVATGGGFRRRADIAELEAQAAYHKASLNSSSSALPTKYRAPKSATEFHEQFPDLGAGADAATISAVTSSQRAPRFSGALRAGDLRPSTRNDEKKARRAAKRAAQVAGHDNEDFEGSAAIPVEVLEEEVSQWVDIEEAVLFEMFPDDTDAVEEALRRFAGLAHQAARALEALLARPQTAPEKTVLAVEDDLDYDRALSGDDAADDDDEEETWDEDDQDEEQVDWLATGCCAGCGDQVDELECDEDDLPYCAWCWAEWKEAEQQPDAQEQPLASSTDSTKNDGFWKRHIDSTRSNDEHSSGADNGKFDGRPDPPPRPQKPLRPEPPPRPKAPTQAENRTESATSTAEGNNVPRSKPAGASQGVGGRAGRIAFFDGLDGAPKWAEAPARPEAGGKELIALQPKSQRDEAVPTSQAKAGRRWARAAPVAVPGAARAAAKPAVAAQTRGERCRELLGLLEPRVEEDVIDYLVSLVEDDESDEVRDTVYELLEGHEVARSSAETFWQGLMAS